VLTWRQRRTRSSAGWRMSQSSPIFGSTSARRMCVLKPLALPGGLEPLSSPCEGDVLGPLDGGGGRRKPGK